MDHSFRYPSNLILRQYPDPILRQVAEPVTLFDDELREFCRAMIRCMDEHNGAGLAASQVGVPRRIFVTNSRRDAGFMVDHRIWVNPRFANRQGQVVGEEGCLSVPAIYADVARFAALDCSWQDEHGAEHRRHLDAQAGEFLAVVVQHEADHLDGRLFIDLLPPAQLRAFKSQLRDLEKSFRKRTGYPGMCLRL